MTRDKLDCPYNLSNKFQIIHIKSDSQSLMKCFEFLEFIELISHKGYVEWTLNLETSMNKIEKIVKLNATTFCL